MPPQFLFDLSQIDLEQVAFDQEAIRKQNPQRGDMEHLNAIVHVNRDLEQILGYKEVRAEEFWVPGHIPGRPLLPGVIMIEAGAQLASFYTKQIIGWTGFIGFGGVSDCKFRLPVTPPARLFLLGQKMWERHRRIGCRIQGVCGGQLVFECDITGTQM